MNLDRKPNLLRTLGAGTKARDGFYQTANVLIVVVISAFIGSYVTQELATPTFPDGMAIALSATSVVLLAAVGLAVTMSRGEAGRRFLLLAAIILCTASILLTATGAGWGKGGSNMGLGCCGPWPCSGPLPPLHGYGRAANTSHYLPMITPVFWLYL